MVLRKPLVIISGLSSQLPPGDTIEGASVSSVATAGSGLSGGGAVSSNFRFDLTLAPNPSGLIFTAGGSGLGIDGSAQISGNAALTLGVSAQASGNAALLSASTAQASGNAGISAAVTAQASGNAALVAASQGVTLGLVIALS